MRRRGWIALRRTPGRFAITSESSARKVIGTSSSPAPNSWCSFFPAKRSSALRWDRTARKFRELGSGSDKEIEGLPAVDRAARTVQIPEISGSVQPLDQAEMQIGI